MVYHLHKKTLQEHHDDMMYNIQQKSEMNRAQPIEMMIKQFATNQYGQQTIAKQQLHQVLGNYGIQLDQNDFEFLTSQYIVNANDGNIHYQKFLDDLRSISGRYQSKMLDSKMSIGFNRAAAGGNQSRV